MQSSPPFGLCDPRSGSPDGEGFALLESKELECKHSKMDIRIPMRARVTRRVRAREIDGQMMLKTTVRTLEIRIRIERKTRVRAQ